MVPRMAPRRTGRTVRPANHEGPDRVSAGQGLVVAVSTSAPEGIRTPNLLIRSQACPDCAPPGSTRNHTPTSAYSIFASAHGLFWIAVERYSGFGKPIR